MELYANCTNIDIKEWEKLMKGTIMDAITVKGTTFKYSKEWYFELSKNDIVTPVWKHGKIRMLLITRRETGEAFYVNANTKEIYTDIRISVIHLTQGTTYLLHENASISVLSTWITFYSINK